MTQHIYKRYKLASAFVLCNTVLVGPAYSVQSITGVMGDYDGFWASTSANVNPLLPDSTNNLLAFTADGVTYSTGVSDGTLDANNITYVPDEFRALHPVESDTVTAVAQGSAVDGNKTVAVGLIHPVIDMDVSAYLVDGINGLDFSTFVLNVGDTWNFSISGLDLTADGDTVPEFFYFNHAAASSQRVLFNLFDASGNRLGQEVSSAENAHPTISRGEYDRFLIADGSAVTTQETPTVQGFSVGFAEFGLTPAELSSVTRLELTLPGQADPPFIAYRSSVMLACAHGDDDGDGFCDLSEGRDVDSPANSVDSDGDGTDDYQDTDSDGDGIPDSVEGSVDTDRDGVLDRLDIDSDNDGILDSVEGLADTDGDGVPDRFDLDSNNDSVPDLLGTGLSEAAAAILDADNNGQIDNSNEFGANGLADAVETATDSDEVDYNGDGAVDTVSDSDSDEVADFLDLDKDNDGIPNLIESGLSLADITSLDVDGDGQIDPPSQPSFNSVGLDGIVDSIQGNVDGDPIGISLLDSDGDTVPDYRDLDSDNDGILDVIESGQADANGDGMVDETAQSGPMTFAEVLDSDNDGIPNNRDVDSDNDGVFDIAGPGVAPELSALDLDNDGMIDAANDPNNDADNDGIFGIADNNPNAFGTAQTLEVDSDGDGISDLEEQNGDPNRDTDGDGILDSLDEDSDNDGFKDNVEGMADCIARDGTDAPDDGDCNDDGVPDRLQGEELSTAVNGVGSSGFGLLALLILVGAGRRSDRPKFALKSVLASLSLLLSASVHASDNDGSSLVFPGSEQRAELSKDTQGGGDRGTAGVGSDLHFYPGYYFGVGVGLSNVDPEGQSNGFETDDSSSSGFKVAVGWHFKPHWAVEFSYADLGSAGLGNPINGTLAALVPDAEIDYRAPAFWLKYLPLEHNRNLTADVKVGVSVLDNSTSSSQIGFDDKSSAQLAFGVGVQLRFEQRYFLRADLESYDGDASFALVTLGTYF